MQFERQRFRFSGGNPFMNALTAVLGVVALIAGIAFGFVALLIFLVAALVFASVVGLRLWWFNRRFRGAATKQRPPSAGAIIDGDYEVVDRDQKRNQ
ncbi:MAG: hypothetical protein AAGC71_16090 [Pseudomonadota bacterium]